MFGQIKRPSGPRKSQDDSSDGLLISQLAAHISEAQRNLASDHERMLAMVARSVDPRLQAKAGQEVAFKSSKSSDLLSPNVDFFHRSNSKGPMVSNSSSPPAGGTPRGSGGALMKSTSFKIDHSSDAAAGSPGDARKESKDVVEDLRQGAVLFPKHLSLAAHDKRAESPDSSDDSSAKSSGNSEDEKNSVCSFMAESQTLSQHKDLIEVMPVWKRDADVKRKSRKQGPSSKELVNAATTLLRASLAEDSFGIYEFAAQKTRTQDFHLRVTLVIDAIFQVLVLHPNSMRRAIWDVSSLVLAIWDSVTIPLMLFDPPEYIVTSIMAWITRLFWTFDIPISFVTGYVESDGSVMLRPGNIMRRYLRTWFVLDICIVFLDWAELLFTSAQNSVGYARAGRAARAMRILRMLRLLRLLRIQHVFKLILERLQSEMVLVVARMAKIMLIIVGLAHISACVWWGIGNIGDVSRTWVGVYNYEHRSLSYCYFSALQWALFLFGGGMDELNPTNTLERIYAVIVFLQAYVTATIFVSNLTSSMTQLHMLTNHRTQALFMLRRYLYTNGISNRLAMRVLRNAQHAILERQRVMPEEAVELLQEVSEPLRRDIHFEMYAPVLSVHHFLRHYIEECPEVMRNVCHRAVSLLVVSKADTIFSHGEICSKPKMYIVCHGELVYVSVTQGRVPVGVGTCISEAALWTHWMHRGMLMAVSDCRLCLLDAKLFQDIVADFDHTHGNLDPKCYAADYVEKLNAMDESDLWDLPISDDDSASTSATTSRNTSIVERTRTDSPEMHGTRRPSILMPMRDAPPPELMDESPMFWAESVGTNRGTRRPSFIVPQTPPVGGTERRKTIHHERKKSEFNLPSFMPS